LELQKEVLRGKEAEYNQIREEIEEVEENVLRRDDQERISESERVFRNGEYGRDNRENQGENIGQLGEADGLHQGISESDLRSDEAGLSFKQRGAEPLRDVSGSIQGEEAGQSLNGSAEESNSIYEGRETSNDEGAEYSERGRSEVPDHDFSIERDDDKGSGRSLASASNFKIRPLIE